MEDGVKFPKFYEVPKFSLVRVGRRKIIEIVARFQLQKDSEKSVCVCACGGGGGERVGGGGGGSVARECGP